jgi:hypothetical protein
MMDRGSRRGDRIGFRADGVAGRERDGLAGGSLRLTYSVPVMEPARGDATNAMRSASHHDSGRSSIQSTYNRRSEKSHAPSIFTNVSS